jgi:hypothetical protein
VPSSNLGRDTAYTDWGVSWSPSVSLGKCLDSNIN